MTVDLVFDAHVKAHINNDLAPALATLQQAIDLIHDRGVAVSRGAGEEDLKVRLDRILMGYSAFKSSKSQAQGHASLKARLDTPTRRKWAGEAWVRVGRLIGYPSRDAVVRKKLVFLLGLEEMSPEWFKARINGNAVNQ